jgi:hypothetical protein
MPRLRPRNDGPDSAWRRDRILRILLIIGSAVGAGTLTATYPEVGVSVNVGAAVFGTLYTVTKDSGPAAPGNDEV